MKLQKKLTIWSTISLIFISVVGIVSWFSVRQLLKTVESVDHTHQMIQHSLQLESYAYKLESAEEHYLFLSDEERFLKEYNVNKNLIEAEFDFLLKKVRTPSQKDLIISINKKIVNWEKNVADVEMSNAKKTGIRDSRFEARGSRIGDWGSGNGKRKTGLGDRYRIT